VIHVRLIVPASRTEDVVDLLCADPRATNIVVMPGAAKDPVGDLVMVDLAREAASQILGRLRAFDLQTAGGITLSDITAAPSDNARRAEDAAPGAPDDGVVWDIVLDHARADAAPSWSYYAFLTLATLIAGVAVVLDSPVLVVGAMVVGPEFGAISAAAVGLALWRPRLAADAARLLLYGFVVAIAVTAVLALAARGAHWIDPSSLGGKRPLTQYIWRPDRWSVVVALLAGCAGVLSQTAGRSNALVGVFISVTTVPAAGNLALAVALWVPGEMGGSAAQLVVNLTGMTVAGVVTLLIQQQLWRRVGRRQRLRAEPGAPVRREPADRQPPGPDRRRSPRP
jgi:uncharacterized hydrophobic protein (TIGR00271 family)